MKKKKKLNKDPSSFRDPSGFVFYQDNKVLRQVSSFYRDEYLLIAKSGFYQQLIDENLIIPFKELKTSNRQAVINLEAERIPFISYPYEWSFSQIKDAALLTLQIQTVAMEKGLSLKDASAYNVQFREGKPIFIDLLSFAQYTPGVPWVAYRQFCQHFLSPLLLMSKVDLSLNQLLRTNLDGIPLPLVSKILPKSSYLSSSIMSHIHLHARNQEKYADDTSQISKNSNQLSKNMLLGIIDSLKSLIEGLSPKKTNTEWGEYYSFTNYSDAAFKSKQAIVDSWLSKIKPKSVWDLGGNTGEFSMLASKKNIPTISFDIDPLAVERNYQNVKERKDQYLLPLVMNLLNQSPALGWNLNERQSLIRRGPVDMALVLALVHHLCISNNIPFESLASYLAEICEHLIIEFVPKSDSKVRKLLATREDIFFEYTQLDFEKSFRNYFTFISNKKVGNGSKRVIYLMKKIS